MPTCPATRDLAAALLVGGAVAFSSCTSGPEIAGGMSSAANGAKTATQQGPGADATGDAGSPTAGKLAANTGGITAQAIQYPSFSLTGQGLTHCDDSSDYGPYIVSASIQTALDDAQSTSTTANFNVTCVNPNDMFQQSPNCESDMNPTDVAKSNNTSTFMRLNSTELAAFKSSGANYVDYLLFAKGVTRSDGLNYSFNPPIPVAVYAADANRYKTTDPASNTWTTAVTGSANMTVHVQVDKVGQDDHSVTVQFTVAIDNDSDWSIYQQFPMPRSSIYVIDTDNQALTSIETVSRSKSTSSHCNSNICTRMYFKACNMTIAGQTTQLDSCSFGATDLPHQDGTGECPYNALP